MNSSERATPLLKRWQLNIIYGVEVVLLAYLFAGAMSGELLIVGKNGKALLRGWAAWIVCLIPFFLSAYFYAQYDPTFGPSSKRRPVAYFFIFMAMLVAVAAGLSNPKGP